MAKDGLKSKAAPPSTVKKGVVERLERIFRYSEDSFQPRAPDSVTRSGKPVRIAYQGEWGSYCHEAAVRAFERCDAVPCGGGMAAAFEAIESGAADRAVVPVENSLDGVIDRNLDLLLRHPRVQIVGEVLLPINHCLLGVNGMELRRIVSHPQALDHCQGRLRRLGVEIEAVENPATAARFVAENGVSDTAVIGSVIAGREFGLRVLEENMQDDSSNTTRFFLLGRSKVGVSSKTTVAFSLEDGAADLYKALSIFALKGIRVCSIQSRPRKENPLRIVDGGDGASFKYFGYVFFVDLEGSDADPAVEDAMDDLKGIAQFVRVLGSYGSHS